MSQNEQCFKPKIGMTVDDRSLSLRLSKPVDREVVIKNINTVCAEEIYLVSDHFVPTPSWEAAFNHEGDIGRFPLLVVAEVEKIIVGHGRLFPSGFGHKDSHVADIGLSILKPYREIGLGKDILGYVIELAECIGYEKLTASILSTNQRSVNLFERLGFFKEGVRVKQFRIRNRYIDEILMGKFLIDESSK